MSTPITQSSPVDHLCARLAEVQAEASAFQASAERQLACYSAVINELRRLINQLTTEDSEHVAT